MGRLGDFVRSLAPGNDHELAATQYAGQESASAKAARKEAARAEAASGVDRSRRSRAADKADRQGNAWADKKRRRYG